MSSKLIRLNEGILVEVEVQEEQAQPVSGGLAQKVNSSLEKIQPILTTVCRPIISSWQQIKDQVDVEKITVELGLSFEGEGNLFVAKSKTGANFTITLELKPDKEVPKVLVPKE